MALLAATRTPWTLRGQRAEGGQHPDGGRGWADACARSSRFVELEPVLMELVKLSDSERAARTFFDAIEAYFARVKRTQHSLHSFLQNTVSGNDRI